MVYSNEIFVEYAEVLSRIKFNFTASKQKVILEKIKEIGILVIPGISDVIMPDESDRIFYDTAKESGSILITGNIKHYPNEGFIMTPREFIEFIENGQ